MKRVFLFLLFLLWVLPASAQGTLTVTCGQSPDTVTMEADYLCVACETGEGTISLSIAEENGKVVYQRADGHTGGAYRSEAIYLPLRDIETRYTLTVTCPDQAYAFTLVRQAPLLSGASAYSAGYKVSALRGKGKGTVTLLDLRQLQGSSTQVPLLAGDGYQIGTVTFSLTGSALSVDAQATAPGAVIEKGTVYAAQSPQDVQGLTTSDFPGVRASYGRTLALQDTPYAAVLVKLSVTYDPNSAPQTGEVTLPGQSALWEAMQAE